jgi:hypothetical protein
MWQPVVPVPLTPLPPSWRTPRRSFAATLGWIVQDYRGHKIIQHGGGTQGFRTVVVLIPEKNTGFVIVNNSEDNEFVPGLEYELLDHYLGLPKHDWPKAFKELFDARNAGGLEAQRAASASRPESKPSLPPAGYAGHYADPWYGPIDVTESNGQLSIDFKQTPGMVAPLEHWAYDTFVARWPDPLIEPAFVSFALDAAGKPSRITMKAYSPVADFRCTTPTRTSSGATGAWATDRKRVRCNRTGPLKMLETDYLVGGSTAQESSVAPGSSEAVRRSAET